MVTATKYTQPRKLNFVSFLVVLTILGMIYGAIQFGPPQYRKWRAKGILSDSANNIYPKRMLSGEAESQFLDEIRQATENQLRALGITDPSLRIFINKTAQEIGVGADYVERIQHPIIGKTTLLHFRPYNTIKID